MRRRPTVVPLEIAALALLLTGCAHGRAGRPLPSNAVVVRVGAHVVAGSPDQLVVNISVSNTTRDTLRLDLAGGSSIASIRLYDTVSGTTQADYDEARQLFVDPTRAFNVGAVRARGQTTLARRQSPCDCI